MNKAGWRAVHALVDLVAARRKPPGSGSKADPRREGSSPRGTSARTGPELVDAVSSAADGVGGGSVTTGFLDVGELAGVIRCRACGHRTAAGRIEGSPPHVHATDTGGFVVEYIEVTFEGTCRRCRAGRAARWDADVPCDS